MAERCFLLVLTQLRIDKMPATEIETRYGMIPSGPFGN